MTPSDEQIVTMTRAEITRLLSRFAEAQRLSDVDELSGLLTEDFKLVGPLGFVIPKQEWLKNDAHKARSNMRPQVDILLDTDQSNDVVGIVELSVPPSWDGPPLHHHDFDEAFYVLDGELTFQLGETLRAAGPGELLFAPRGMIHTLANLADQHARYVLVCTPGQFTRYFEQFSATVSTDTATAPDKGYPETTVVGPTIPERLSRAA